MDAIKTMVYATVTSPILASAWVLGKDISVTNPNAILNACMANANIMQHKATFVFVKLDGKAGLVKNVDPIGLVPTKRIMLAHGPITVSTVMLPMWQQIPKTYAIMPTSEDLSMFFTLGAGG